jgi:K+-sensing histidine kinase KdpD
MEPLDVRDVDERRPDDSVAASGRTRAGYLGFVAHEIRNPLSTALWTAELLARMPNGERGGPRGEKLSAMCLRSVTRVRQLVEDHLLSERLDAGGFGLRIEPVVVADAVAAVLERRPPECSAATVELDQQLAVDADRALLERAIDGLVAVAGADRTPVHLAARVEGGLVELKVSGHPADPAALADPVKGSPSDASGRALSLPLARRIARVLGGTLSMGEASWKLTLPAAGAYTSRPTPAADP